MGLRFLFLEKALCRKLIFFAGVWGDKMKIADLGRLAHLLLKFRPHAIMLLDAQSKRLGSFLRLLLRLVREGRGKNDR